MLPFSEDVVVCLNRDLWEWLADRMCRGNELIDLNLCGVKIKVVPLGSAGTQTEGTLCSFLLNEQKLHSLKDIVCSLETEKNKY